MAAFFVSFLVGCGQNSRVPAENPEATWSLASTAQQSGTDVLLQAVSPVTDRVVWISGHGGTWATSLDGGETWSASVMAGEEELQFRDVHAVDAATAYLMSAGEGDLSRIYRTDDGGASWVLQFRASHPDAFLDCMDFWDRDRGLVFGDEVDGVLFILRTEDGGSTWERVPADALPPAQEGEGGFAASGTCIVTGPEGWAWISTGNAERARVLVTSDWGRSWSPVEVPSVAGSGAGLTTIQMAEDGRGIALGGVIGNDTTWSENVVVTVDSGASWTLAGLPAMPGPVYGSALVVDDERAGVVAVGPAGMNLSLDWGTGWQGVDTLTYWAVAFADPGTGWAVGPEGRVARLSFQLR